MALPPICRRGHYSVPILLFCVATFLGLLVGMNKTRGLAKAQSASRVAVLPLARQLAQRDRRKGATATRADIVSPALCGTYGWRASGCAPIDSLPDDILSYIGPSLEKYKNCDIVDVNPGAGLWSSKIHDFLKPRRHLLLEVDDFYTPCLQPLLDAPGSKYIRGPATDSVLSTLRNVVNQGLLPDQHPLPKGDSRLNEPNTSLLLLLNLSRMKTVTSRTAYFLTRDTLNLLSASAWMHAGLNRYGHVRTLLWVPEYFKDRIVPRELNQLDSYGFTHQARTRTHAVAGHPNPKLPREDTTVELASAVRAANKMRSAGLELPPHRQDRMHQAALSLLKERDVEDVQAKLRADIISAQSPLDEMAELETRLKSKAPPLPNRAVWLQRLKHLQSNTERNLKSIRWKHVRLKELWATADEVRQLEMIVVDESRPAQERLAAKEHWEKLSTDCKVGGRRGPAYIQQALFNVIDSRRGFYQDPPLLAWDDRPFEPLTTEPHEFYPQQSLCLLDSNPQPAPQEYSEEYIEYWQRFVNKLFERSSTPIGKALDHLRIGSAEVILPQVGAIHDPRRGGSLDVEDVRVRSMTPEMSYEIVDAWKNWTFRPQELEETLTKDRLNWEELMENTEERRLAGDLFDSKITGPVSRP